MTETQNGTVKALVRVGPEDNQTATDNQSATHTGLAHAECNDVQKRKSQSQTRWSLLAIKKYVLQTCSLWIHVTIRPRPILDWLKLKVTMYKEEKVSLRSGGVCWQLKNMYYKLLKLHFF